MNTAASAAHDAAASPNPIEPQPRFEAHGFQGGDKRTLHLRDLVPMLHCPTVISRLDAHQHRIGTCQMQLEHRRCFRSDPQPQTHTRPLEGVHMVAVAAVVAVLRNQARPGDAPLQLEERQQQRQHAGARPCCVQRPVPPLQLVPTVAHRAAMAVRHLGVSP